MEIQEIIRLLRASQGFFIAQNLQQNDVVGELIRCSIWDQKQCLLLEIAP